MSTNSAECMFAIDLINFVMECRKIDWKFHEYFLKNIQSTPFTPMIRNFVSDYLEYDETNIYFVFARMSKGSNVDSDMFQWIVEYLRTIIFTSVNTVSEAIRYCIVIAQFSLLAYQTGAHLAPYVALKEIQEAMKTFISDKEESSSIFWASLDSQVSKLRVIHTFYTPFCSHKTHPMSKNLPKLSITLKEQKRAVSVSTSPSTKTSTEG
ncbi:hypothetical protein TNIN_201221 [Trichonephila inaurata madagascariensis]|uniref:Uncharacterized protein n=1 Tax=Trichonephila inaurata madagascariensis TaxID=2747483 RepID=A0A8X6X490_9ARAC|nr:hypothetical protein TNIN_201221 [Trichonephila inaurata madagascariensis]